ncbi:hypothetical protein DUZ99_02855 [Xylanibacillus composti]|nr:hypothetical protein [Xylanibacillus composti]
MSGLLSEVQSAPLPFAVESRPAAIGFGLRRKSFSPNQHRCPSAEDFHAAISFVSRRRKAFTSQSASSPVGGRLSRRNQLRSSGGLESGTATNIAALAVRLGGGCISIPPSGGRSIAALESFSCATIGV